MSYTHLSSKERYVISYLVLYGLSLREISRRLNRHHSTISREIKRNRPTYADDAVSGMRLPKSSRIRENVCLVIGPENPTHN